MEERGKERVPEIRGATNALIIGLSFLVKIIDYLELYDFYNHHFLKFYEFI